MEILHDTRSGLRLRPAAETEGVFYPGNYYLSGDDVKRADSDGKLVDVPDKNKDVLRAFVEMKTLVRQIKRAEGNGMVQEADEARARLRSKYDAFVAKHKWEKAVKVFEGDSDASLVASLRMPDGTPAPFLTENTMARTVADLQAASAEEVLSASVAWRGGVHWEWMARMSGRSVEQLHQALPHLVFRMPPPYPEWQLRHQLLSDNVRKKLDAVKGLAEYKDAAKALEEVVPRWIPISEVKVSFGAHWVPAEVYESFLWGDAKVKQGGGIWFIKGKHRSQRRGRLPWRIIEAVMNNKRVVARYRSGEIDETSTRILPEKIETFI